MYNSEKAKFLRNLIRTPDVLCRLTSLENIDSLHSEFRYIKNILDPSYSPISSLHAAWLRYPLFYKEGHEALETLDWSIHANGSHIGLHDVSVQEFIMPFLPAASSQRYVLQLRDLGLTQMKDLLPSLFDVAGPLPTDGSLDVTAEIDTLQFSSLAAQRATIEDEVFSLSTSIRHVPIPSDFQVAVFSKAVRMSLENYLWTNRWGDFKRPLSDRVCSFPKGVSFSSLIASDGSFKDNLASFAVKCNSHSFTSTLPGMQTIQRAELFGILAAIWVTDPLTSVTLVTDSYSSKSVIDSLWNQRLMPRRYACPANDSILSCILQLLEERERFGNETLISWIPSHSTGNDDKLEYLLNAAADRLATEAHPIQVSECLRYMDRITSRIPRDVL
jgi:ribonuclease HI